MRPMTHQGYHLDLRRASSASASATAFSNSCAATFSTPPPSVWIDNICSRLNRSTVPATKNLLGTLPAFFSLMAKKFNGGQTNIATYLTYVVYTVYTVSVKPPPFRCAVEAAALRSHG